MEAGWAREEMVGARLWDGRCRRSLVRISARLGQQPGVSLSAACGATLRHAAHRIFAHPQTTVAGLLAGAENPEAGRLVVEFLLSPEVQAAMPESMYVFPVRDDVDLPADWAAYAEQPEDPYVVDPADIAAHRDTWLQEWRDLVTR